MESSEIVTFITVALVTGLLLVWKVFEWRPDYCASKLLAEMSTARWVPLHEIVAAGYPKFYCRIVLPQLCRQDCVEVALKNNFAGEDPTEEDLASVYEEALPNPRTVEFFEYRRASHKPPAKNNERGTFPELQPA